MTWPRTALPMGFELYYAGAWHDHSADVSDDDGLSISRGRADEGAQVDPSSMSLKLRNTAGRYSPRNPNSDLFGLIGRNTPARAWIEPPALLPRFVLDGAAAALTTPDSAGLSITGDLEVAWEGALGSWRASTDLVSKYGAAGQRSWALQVTSAGFVALYWSADGTALLGASSTVAVRASTGRTALKVTLDVNNGAAGRTVTFWQAPSIGGTWTQLGDAVVQAGTTSVFDSTAPVTVGKNANTSAAAGLQVVRAVWVVAGIGGTVKANPTASTVTSGASSFTDAAGAVWTVGVGAAVTARRYRFWGEVTEWPQKWGLKGAPQSYSPIQCSGVMRRLGQGATPLRSAMWRGSTSIGATLAGYWPLEDAVGSEALAAGMAGRRPAKVTAGAALAAYDGFVASEPIPALHTGRIVAVLPAAAVTGTAQVRWLTRIPAGTPNGAVLARVRTTSSLGWVDVCYSTGGGWFARVYNNLGVLGHTSSTYGFALDDRDLRVSLELAQSGGDVVVTLAEIEAGASGGLVGSSTATGITLGAVKSVEFNPEAVDLGDLTVGHLTVQSAITTLFDLSSQLAGYRGEAADARLVRLGAENGLAVHVQGGDTALMGVQGREDLVALLREAADTDGGVLHEPRTSSDLTYRSLESMYSQVPVVVAYTDNLLSPFEPTDDDQGTQNLVTVTRAGGSSATVEDTTSTLSTAPPPAGVGVYDTSVTLSLASDDAARHQAGWRVHLGTVDEARWPVIGVRLEHPVFLADAVLSEQLLDLDVGDRLDVTDLPVWLPPFPARVLVQGYQETILPFSHTIELTGSPASPFDVAYFGDARYGGPGSTLAASVTTTATSWSVATPVGPLWTTAGADFPLDVLVEGELVTVTGVSGSSSPQSFTVTRSVNGVVKAHASGAAVDLADPTYYGL